MSDDETMKKLLEMMKPKPPTMMDLVWSLAYYCAQTVLMGTLLGIGLRLAGLGVH